MEQGGHALVKTGVAGLLQYPQESGDMGEDTSQEVPQALWVAGHG